jgi:threonine synthase
MSRCLAYFNKDKKDSKNTVLVASGDTGGACVWISGRWGEVIILLSIRKGEQYSRKQLTTLGQN